MSNQLRGNLSTEAGDTDSSRLLQTLCQFGLYMRDSLQGSNSSTRYVLRRGILAEQMEDPCAGEVLDDCCQFREHARQQVVELVDGACAVGPLGLQPGGDFT